MAAGKLARTVGAQSGVHHIGILPVPAQTSEVRYGTRVAMRTASCTQTVIGRCSSTIIYVCVSPVVKSFFQIAIGGTYRCTLVSAGLHTNQCAESVLLVHRPVILSGIGPGHCQSVVHRLTGRCASVVIAVWTEMIEC